MINETTKGNNTTLESDGIQVGIDKGKKEPEIFFRGKRFSVKEAKLIITLLNRAVQIIEAK
jgi:hypothetical protein